MIHSAPSSTTDPFDRVEDQTRPPTRSRASNTVTCHPRSVNRDAAISPESPAPTTTTLRDVSIIETVRSG